MTKIIKMILLNTVHLIIGLCILYNIIFLINTTISEEDYFKVFGISLFNMTNDLMQGDINKNDLVVVKEVNEKEIQEGDIIAYKVNGKIRINKIINKQEQYTTKSNKNYYPDIEKISSYQVIGEVVVCMPFIGLVIEILHSKVTTIFIFIFLIFYFLYNKNMYIKIKKRARKKKRYDREII